MWNTIFFWAAVTGFATWGLTLFFVGMIFVQAWRENRAFDKANERLSEYIRKSYGDD